MSYNQHRRGLAEYEELATWCRPDNGVARYPVRIALCTQNSGWHCVATAHDTSRFQKYTGKRVGGIRGPNPNTNFDPIQVFPKIALKFIPPSICPFIKQRMQHKCTFETLKMNWKSCDIHSSDVRV